MADRLDKLIAEVARSTYGAAQSWGKNGRGGGLGASRGGINRGSAGYPVPDIMDPKERPELEEGEAPLAKSPVQDDPSKDPNVPFSDWIDEAETKLPKGIAHLEDLKPEEFLNFLEKYRDLPLKGGLEVSEKVDGSARISFGAEGSKVWTQSKNGPKRYNSEEYPDQPMYRALRNAHKALESKGAQIAKAVPPDTFFVAEVLYTKIPNSIEYGPNVIMVHGVHQGERTLSDEESRKLAQQVIKSAGGQLSDGTDKWKFEYKRTVDPKDVMVDVKKEFKSLKDVYSELKRLEPDRLKAAGKVPYKAALEQFKAIQLAVKKKLVGQLRKQKSAYGPEGGDVEGLVFRDLESGQLVKLVDKEYFTALNKFLWHYREMLDKGAKVGDKWEFGILQKFRNAIADEVLGAPIAKTPGFVKMLRTKYAGGEFPPEADTPEKRADTVLARYIKDENLMQGDFVEGFRRETEKVKKDFEKLRKKWDAEKKTDPTQTIAGKTVKMDPLIKQRTDDAFTSMEEFFATVARALQTIGSLRGELTKKVGLLKIMMGSARFEKLAAADEGQQEESVMHEAAEPGQGSERLTPDEQRNLVDFMIYHYKKLKKRKVELEGAKKLGAGSNGIAMLLRDGRVLKATYDKSEAHASMAIKGKKFKHVIHIDDVFQFPPMKGESNVYGIVQEKLEPISDEERNEFTDMAVADVEVESGMFSRIWQLPNWQDIVDNAMEGAGENGKEGQRQKTAHALKVLQQKYQMDQIVAELRKAGIAYGDFHGGNIGKRGNDYVVMDLGHSKSKGAKPPVLERVTEAVIDLLEAEPDSYAATEPQTKKAPSGYDKTSIAKTQQKGSPKATTGVTTQIAQQVIKKNAQKLAKRSINASQAKPLGQGTRGVAFDVGGNRVLKITNDAQEAVASYKLMGMALKHVAKFSDVFRFPDDEELVGGVYGILQEKLEPFPGMGKDPSGRDASGDAANLNRAILAFNLQETIYRSGGQWDKVKEACQQQIWDKIGKQYPNWKSDEIDKKYAIEYAKKMNAQWDIITKQVHIDMMVQELTAKGIKFHDYHAGNIMKRPNGDYVLIDIGYSKVAGGKEPPVLEQMMEALLAQIAVLGESGGMRGIGGSMPNRFMGPSPARKQDKDDLDEQKPSFPDDRQEYVGVHGGPNPAENGELDRFAEAVLIRIVEADDGTKEFGAALMQGIKSKTKASPLKKMQETPADKVGVTIGRYQPFHAGHAAVIRRLAGQFNKVIVLVAGNKPDKKNPFTFETRLDLMKRSLPDVYAKLEIHKAEVGGKASGFVPGILSDIVKDKKSTVEADTAIEVLVGPDREAEVKQQMDRARQYKESGKGEMLFDPDMAIVRGLPGVKNDDDTDRISGTRVREAIAKGDKDTFKKMMDPHLVSNPDQLESLFGKMKTEMQQYGGAPVKEGVINEKLDDVGGLEGLKGIMLAHADAVMEKYHIDFRKVVNDYLGAGDMGAVFDLGGGKVLKVTTSTSEGPSAMKLKGKQLKHVTHVFDVFKLSNRRDKNKPITCIVRDELQKLPPAEFNELNALVDLLRDPKVINTTIHGDFAATMQACRQLQQAEIRRDLGLQGETPADPNAAASNKRELRAKSLTDQKMQELETRLRHYQIDQMMKDLRSAGVQFADYKGDAIRKRGPNYVLSDFGGGGANGPQPPLVEKMVEAIMNEIGITFNTNTPGGTQSGLRAGSSGWSAPMNRYTDDDVRAAREEPDEFELWSDKLKNINLVKGR